MEEQGCASLQRAEGVCRELVSIEGGDWGLHQEQDTDLGLVVQWVGAQEKPPWEEVAALSRVTKGLWAKFGVLHLHQGVLQQA